MRRLLAPAGRHVGSKTLSTKNKAPEGSYPIQGTRTKILNCVSSLWRHFSSSRFSIF